MDNTLLTDVSFVNIFFQPVACLLILLTLSFAKKFLVWMKSRLSVLSFMDHSSGVLTVTFILKAIKVFSHVMVFEFYSFVLYI